VAAAALAAAPLNPLDAARETRYRMEPRLDPDGALAGQRLQIDVGRRRSVAIDLPPESAAAGPFGTLVVVAADDGYRSAVRAIDAEAGCAAALGGSDDVVRRATLAPTGDAVYESRVNRATRRDLGVWRRPLDGGEERRVLPPLPDDRAFGVTWTTTLAWSADGAALAVQSCGAHQCRSRVVDRRSGGVASFADHGQGELIGLAGDVLVTYAACTGLPCPIIGTELGTGRSRTIAPAAGLARLIDTAAGPRVVSEAGRGVLALHALDGTLERHVPLPDPALRPVPTADRAAGDIRVPPGFVLLSRDGGPTSDAILTSLADGASVRLSEVTP
jgi:hypothetical protein